MEAGSEMALNLSNHPEPEIDEVNCDTLDVLTFETFLKEFCADAVGKQCGHYLLTFGSHCFGMSWFEFRGKEIESWE